MVVFTCNFCGDSVNKPKAEKHITIECKRKRYGVASLCCVDCLKDFDFCTYSSHTKCMTEEQRYSAPGFVPKPSSCKGEKKQSSWIETVPLLLKKPDLTPLQRSVLQTLTGYQNIPRKKAKFLNFMTSSANYRITDRYLLEVVFNLMESEFKAANSSAQTSAKSLVKEENSSINASQNPKNTGHDLPVQNGIKSTKVEAQKPNTNVSQPNNTGDDVPVENGIESPKVKEKKKKNKKSKVDEESVEESQVKPLNHVDLPEGVANGFADNHEEDEGFTNVKRSKKKKKEKKDVDVPMEITEAEPNVADVDMNSLNSNNDVSFQNDDRIIVKSRGKKKHKHRESTSVDETVADDVDESSEIVIPENTVPSCPVEESSDKKPEKKKKKRKRDHVDDEDVDSKRSRIETTENEISPSFSWSNVVKTLLEKSKEHEMSVKRMTKKVVAEYQSFYSSDKSFEDIAKKFNKKVKKLPFVIVSKDRIQLYVE